MFSGMSSGEVDGKLSIQFHPATQPPAPPPVPGAPGGPPAPPPVPDAPGSPPAPDNLPAGNLYHQLCVMAAVADSLDEYQVEQHVHRQSNLCLFSRQFMSDLKHPGSP